MKVIEQDIIYGDSLRGKRQAIISIVTVVSNPTNVLIKTVNSVLTQTWQQFEWVIVEAKNEGLGTSHILGQARVSDERIRIVTQSSGVRKPSLLNAGVSEAKGAYIFFLDEGNILSPVSLEKMLLTLSINPDLDFVNAYSRKSNNEPTVLTGGFNDRELFFKENRNSNCFIARAGLFKKVYFDESLIDGSEYWDFWLNSALHGFWGYTIPEILCEEGISKKDYSGIVKVRSRLDQKYGSLKKTGFPDKKLADYKYEKQIGDTGIPVANNNSTQQKNVLFLFPYLEIGGADKFNLDLITGLKEKGWKLTIACTLKNDNAWFEDFNRQTEDIFFLHNYSNYSQYFKALYHLIITRKPSVIFLSNSLYGYYILPYIKKKFPWIPVVDYLHCEAPGWYNGGYPYFSTIYQKLLDRTIVSSNNLKEWCVAKGADDEKIEVCYINIDVNSTSRNEAKRQEIRKDLNIPQQTPVLLYVARLTEQKQPMVLLKSIEKLYKKQQNFYCLIIGDGPDKKRLLYNIKRSPAKKAIRYLGKLSNEDVKDYMDAADIFFLPSAFEGIALSIYEAMAKELAVVGARVGGQDELVEKDCGFLVERSDSEKESNEYADILYELTADTTRIARMGKNSRNRVVNEFNLSKMISGVESILNNCIKSGSKAETEISREYLFILNHLVFQTHVTDVLWMHSNSRLNSFLKRYRKPYRIAGKIYHKLKESFFS